MTHNFPRILTLLRKERGISQKQAAANLNISQSLLSHYEKGIRECGLAFLVRVADYYQVSCDYLLGRAADRTGAMLTPDQIQEPDYSQEKILKSGSVLSTLNKKLLVNSITILFDLVQKVDNREITMEMSNYLMLGVYHVFRMLYEINPKNEDSLFSVPPLSASQYVYASCLLSEARMLEHVKKLFSKKSLTSHEQSLSISTQTLERDYQQLHSSLLNLIRNAEKCIAAE